MKFIALPVGMGDAFYAQTSDGFRTLVDGGRSRRELPRLFERYTGLTGVDVLVCTHNDADHAEGLIGFLESGLACKELWLPATWVDAIRSLPEDAEATSAYLRDRLRLASQRDIAPVRAEGSDLQEVSWRSVSPERIEQRPISDTTQQRKGHEPYEVLGFTAPLDERTVVALEEHLNLFADPWDWGWRPDSWHLPDSVVRAGGMVARDIRRLLELVWLAVNRGIPVRAFRHDPAGAGPLTSPFGYPLQPLNARPSYRARKLPKTAQVFFDMAFLTTVNRESLVLFLDTGDGQPGVLFTADSDLKGVNVARIAAWSVATAPHHGSLANRSVYGLINKPMVWVRSDRYSRKRPCNEFLQAPGVRFCTLCRNSGEPKQAVRLQARQRTWVRVGTRPCQCR